MSENRAPGDIPSVPSDPSEPRRAKAGSSRDERLAAALRANLARRKAQGRARAAIDVADETQEE